MGVSQSSTSVVTRSVQHEGLRRERDLKSEEKVMLIMGTIESGKNDFISRLIELYKHLDDGDDVRNDFIESKYQIGPFYFNELTPKSLSLHATCNFKYICKDIEYYDSTYSYKDKDGVIDVVIVDNNKKQDKHYINYRLLFDGYFREFLFENNIENILDIPRDIGTLIELFYEKPTINNYKIDIKSTIFDFWELDFENKTEFSWCYRKAVCMIFIIDISCYDEINIKTNKNKLSESIKLFYEIVTSLRSLSGQSLILILNKSNKFKQKIENNIPISICKELKHITSNDYNIIIKNIEDIFRNTAKTIKSAVNTFVHTVSNNFDNNEMQRIANDFVHIVISYTLGMSNIHFCYFVYTHIHIYSQGRNRSLVMVCVQV